MIAAIADAFRCRVIDARAFDELLPPTPAYSPMATFFDATLFAAFDAVITLLML